MISYVIPSREESPDVLGRTVDELRETSSDYEHEIIVVDDGSSVPVRGLPAEVEVLRNIEPLGASRARRRGCELARGGVLVSLDAHMTFDTDWLTRMLAHVDSGALLCSAYWDYERAVGACYGADLQWCGVRDYDAALSPGLRPAPRTEFPGPGAHEVPMALGACYMMLRSSYELLGGFSPLFRVWGAEEQDLSMRAWMAGLGVRCVADARVGHLSRRSFPYPVHYDYLEFNQLAMIRSLFDYRTVRVLEAFFEPVSDPVRAWLAATDLATWRPVVQHVRQCTDSELFQRFVPELYQLLESHRRSQAQHTQPHDPSLPQR